MRVCNSILELIGNTPIIKLNGFKREYGIEANIFGKLESFNPAGSVKDRIALAMIESAEREGKLVPGSTIIEPTSGNTGIGLAAVAAAKGYELIITMPETMSVERRSLVKAYGARVVLTDGTKGTGIGLAAVAAAKGYELIITMPETMSVERRSLVKAYGARVVLTDGTKGMRGAIAKAEELAKEIPNSFIPSQFSNMANPAMHYNTTGPEIWAAMAGNIDILVSGVGTGGTVSGAGKFLREKNSDIKIVAVEPKDSPVLTRGVAGSHKIQGLGAGFVPDTLNTDIYDEVIAVSSEDAFDIGRALARTDAVLVGISSGAALWAGLVLSKRPENKGKNILVVLPDTGERYLSTPMFSDSVE